MDIVNALERPIPVEATPIEALAIILECSAETLSADSSMLNHARWDSFAHVELMAFLGDRFQVELTEANLVKYSTLSALQALSNERTG